METLAQEVAIAKARKAAFYRHIAQKEAAAAEKAKKKAAVEERQRIRRESASKAADETRFEEVSRMRAQEKMASAGTRAGWSRLRNARMGREMVERAGRIEVKNANPRQYSGTAAVKMEARDCWMVVCRANHPCHEFCCHCYLEGLMDGLYEG